MATRYSYGGDEHIFAVGGFNPSCRHTTSATTAVAEVVEFNLRDFIRLVQKR